jgi:hypothetical protein
MDEYRQTTSLTKFYFQWSKGERLQYIGIDIHGNLKFEIKTLAELANFFHSIKKRRENFISAQIE